MSTELTSGTADETESLGERFSKDVDAGDLILLEGDLAAGKTTFVRGLVRGLNGDPLDVSSPTFVLIQSYPCAARGIAEIHHVDLYRLADESQPLREVGIEELLSDPSAVIAIEWPKQAILDWVPRGVEVHRVTIEIVGENERRIRVGAQELEG